MWALVEAVERYGVVLPGGILKADALVNHQLQPALTREMGAHFAAHFAPLSPSKVLTIEVSGIAPALVTALALNVPMLYARKRRPVTMTGPVYTARSLSRTGGGEVTLFVSGEFLGPGDRVVVIDDFLASGGTLLALADIISQSGAALLGVGCVIEKAFERGRERLAHLNVPVHTLAVVHAMSEAGGIEVTAGR